MEPDLFSPTGNPSQDGTRLAERLASLEQATVGVVDNGKPNGDRFFAHVGELLQERCGVADLISVRKEMISQPAARDTIADLAARSHLILTGIGD